VLRWSTAIQSKRLSRSFENARAVLRPVFDQFVEGSGTADMKSAVRLLETLS
jgi:hypothetical protein